MNAPTASHELRHQHLARYIQKRMEELQLSLRDLERLTSLSHGHLGRLRRGETGNPELDTLKALSRGLRVPVDTLQRIARGLPPEPAIGNDLAAAIEAATPEVKEAIRHFLAQPAEEQERLLPVLAALLQTIPPRPNTDQ